MQVIQDNAQKIIKKNVKTKNIFFFIIVKYGECV